MGDQNVAYSWTVPVTVLKQCPAYLDSIRLEAQTGPYYLPLCSAGEEGVCGARAGVEVLTPCFCLLSGVAASCGGSPVRTGLPPFACELFPAVESRGGSSPE